MLTIFSCPKPFRDHINIIQRNAIQSWTRLSPKPQIILLGDEEGIAAVTGKLGICQIPNIERNEFGTPLVSSLFEEAEKAAIFDNMCYVNADIILMNNFMEAIKNVFNEMPNSLVVGRRWNLNIKEAIDFKGNWEQWLKEKVAKQGKLFSHYAIDYFVYPKGIWGKLPPFAIGRPGWDNWVIYRAHSQNLPIVDLTKMVPVIHQNHDYSHHPQGRIGAMRGIESKQNIELAGEIGRVYSLLDAQYYLTGSGIRRKITPFYSPHYIFKKLVILSESYRLLKPLINFIRLMGNRFFSPSLE